MPPPRFELLRSWDAMVILELAESLKERGYRQIVYKRPAPGEFRLYRASGERATGRGTCGLLCCLWAPIPEPAMPDESAEHATLTAARRSSTI